MSNGSKVKESKTSLETLRKIGQKEEYNKKCKCHIPEKNLEKKQ